jgi:parallel beta-helix repeat protein
VIHALASAVTIARLSVRHNLFDISSGGGVGVGVTTDGDCIDYDISHNKVIINSSDGRGFSGLPTASTVNPKRGRYIGNTIINNGSSTAGSMGIELVTLTAGWAAPTDMVFANNTIICTNVAFGGMSTNMSNSSIVGNTIRLTGSNWNYGMELPASMSNTTVSGNTIDCNGHGACLILNGASDNTVTGNMFINPDPAPGLHGAVSLYADAAGNGLNASRNIISNNVFRLPGTSRSTGVVIEGNDAAAHTDHNVVANNIIYGNSNSQGIQILEGTSGGGGTATGNMIAGNKIVTANYGLVLQYDTNTTIKNNVVSGINTDNVLDGGGTHTGITLVGNSWQ